MELSDQYILEGGRLPQPTPLHNDLAIRLYNLYKKVKPGQTTFLRWFTELTSSIDINLPALLTHLHKLQKMLKKKRGLLKIKLLEDVFVVPTNANPSQHLPEMSLAEELNLSQKKIKLAQTKVHHLQQKVRRVNIKISDLNNNIKALHMTRRHNASLKHTIERLHRQLMKEKETYSSNMAEKNSKQKDTVISLRRLLKQYKDEIKSHNVKLESNSVKISHHDELCRELAGAKEEVLNLATDNDYLQNLLQDDSPLTLYDNTENKYSYQCIETVMKLLDLGVPHKQVSPVIAAVSKLCGREANQLPNISTINLVNHRRLAVSHQQVAELQHEQNMTLYTDETSKYGSKYMVYATTTKDDEVAVLGMKPIATKSAKDTLDTLCDTLAEITQSCGVEGLSDTLVYNIKNTMSDRASTEKAFNTLLQEYRGTILPKVVDNFDNLPEDKQQNLKEMNNFFCGLHLLVSMAESFSSSILKLEKMSGHSSLGAATKPETRFFVKQSESGIVRFIRTACKLLSRGGDEKSGCYANFTAYLKSQGKQNILTQFKHNRFNILFHNGGAVFNLLDNIIEFLQLNQIPNTLAKAVLYDAQEEWCVSGCQSLGLISKFITAPLWRLLEDKEIHIADISTVYTDIISFLSQCAEDDDKMMCFMNGTNNAPSLINFICEDDMSRNLCTTPHKCTPDILKHIFNTWVSLLQKLVKDHLSGGKFESMDDSQRFESQSVVKHNKLAEELFGRLDRLMQKRPVATCLTNESHIVFGKNKTFSWLESKDDEQKQKIIDSSTKQATVIRKNFQKITNTIQKRRLESLKDRQLEIQRLEMKAFKNKEAATEQIIHYGLWQSPSEISTKLCELTGKKEKVTALKAQLNFRRLVLQQPVKDKSIFNFSSKEIGLFCFEHLTDNLLVLVKSAHQLDSDGDDAVPAFLVGKQIQHRFQENDASTWFNGRVISQVPGFPKWFNVIYEDDPSVYSYQLMDDYSSGDLILKVSEDHGNEVY